MVVLQFLKSRVGMVLAAIIVLALVVGVVAPASSLLGDDLTDGSEPAYWEGMWLDVNIDSTKYATSWKSDGLSEKIFMNVSAKFSSERWLGDAIPLLYRFRAYVNGQNFDIGTFGEWKKTPWAPSGWSAAEIAAGAMNPLWLLSTDVPGTIGSSVPKSQYLQMGSGFFTLRGEYADMELKVYCEVQAKYVGGTRTWEVNKAAPKAAPWDGAYLESGASTLYIDGNTYQQGDSAITKVSYEEGDNFKAQGQTGFSGGQGWVVKLYAPTDRPDLASLNGKQLKTISDDQTFEVSVTIGAGWFKAGTSNQFHLELWNHLWATCRLLFFSVDDYSKVPGAPVMDVAVDGGTATISITSKATSQPIQWFQVMVWYGGAYAQPPASDSGSWILYDRMLPAAGADGGNYSASVSFTVRTGYSGDIAMEAIAIDVDGRHSDKAVQVAQVDNGGIAPPTPPTPPKVWHWTLTVYVCIALTVLLAALMAYLNKGRPAAALALALTIMLIGAAITYVVGYDPELADTISWCIAAAMGGLA